MGCDTSVKRVMQTVWTKRSTSTVFVPFYRGDALRNRGCKVDFRLSEIEGTTQVRPGMRYSNDGGKTWSASEAMVTAWTSSTSWVHMDHFHAVNNDYMLFEVGLEVQNASGTTQGTARAEIVVTMATVLDLEIGRDVQEWSAGLDDIAGITPVDGTFIVGNASGDWVAKTPAQVKDVLDFTTTDAVQFLRAGLGVAPNASYSLTTAGAASFGAAVNIAVTGSAALTVSGAEALWYNGTYFSWGFGGTWNRFADKVRIGDTTTPTQMLEVQGNAALSGGLTVGADSTFSADVRIAGEVQLDETGSPPSPVAGRGVVWVKNTTPASLFYTDDTTSPAARHHPVAGPAKDAWAWVVRTADSGMKTVEFDPWQGTSGIDDKYAQNISRNTSTGVFTVTYAGTYTVRADMILRSGASAGTRHQVVLKILKNGSAELTREVDVNPDWGEQSHTAEGIIPFAASDTVEITVTPQSTYSVSAEDDSTFTIHRIGGTG